MSAEMLTICPWWALTACPPMVPREMVVSGREWSATVMVMMFSSVLYMLQMTLGFHGQLNRPRKQHVTWLGFRRISAYGLNFLCNTSVFKHKGKVPGIDEYRVSVSNPFTGDFLCDAHDIESTLGVWQPQRRPTQHCAMN